MKGYWSVETDGVVNGYINQFADSQFDARKPPAHSGKGGFAPLLGTFPTLEAARDALAPQNLK